MGSNTVWWNPSLTFALLESQVAGTYSGTEVDLYAGAAEVRGGAFGEDRRSPRRHRR